MTATVRLLDEMCHLTAQSLTLMDTPEHFHVLKVLGEGSYGKVMLAVHKKRGTPMALKFFPRKSTQLFAFLREYNLSLSFCTHPSLTRALGIAYYTSSHYIFAQQASLYGDLYDVIVPEVGIEENACQRVVSQISGALSHLHSLGFVHRDLKPENIFLCDPSCRWVKLGDFGLVKATGTKVTGVWYSSAYCTPEAEVAKTPKNSWRFVGGKQEAVDMTDKGNRVLVSVDPSTDCWALGILTYAMLTGSLPWAETASDNRSYKRYLQWFKRVKGYRQGYRLDVWEEDKEQTGKDECILGLNDEELSEEHFRPIAPQFSCFTPLACSLFQALLHPNPRLRAKSQDVLSYLGGDWLREDERLRLEEKRKNMK